MYVYLQRCTHIVIGLTTHWKGSHMVGTQCETRPMGTVTEYSYRHLTCTLQGLAILRIRAASPVGSWLRFIYMVQCIPYLSSVVQNDPAYYVPHSSFAGITQLAARCICDYKAYNTRYPIKIQKDQYLVHAVVFIFYRVWPDQSFKFSKVLNIVCRLLVGCVTVTIVSSDKAWKRTHQTIT